MQTSRSDVGQSRFSLADAAILFFRPPLSLPPLPISPRPSPIAGAGGRSCQLWRRTKWKSETGSRGYLKAATYVAGFNFVSIERVVWTVARGFWILDDLTPLQQLTPQVLAESTHLFPPLPAYRFRQITNDSVIREDEVSAGNDPPYGAGINYYLKQSAPAGTVTITILDSKGQVVRVLPGTTIVGINRIHWNLRYETSTPIQMRTTRRSSDGGQLAILAPPGSYRVKLSVGGREFTQPLTVIKDPHSGGTEADIQAQMTTPFELGRDMDRAADLVNATEMARSQIEALVRVVDDQTITKAADALNQKLMAVEENLVELKVRAGGGSRLARKLSYLASELASSDFKPTNQQLEVQQLLEERLATFRGLFDALRARDLSALNELLRQRKVPHIITTEAR